VLPIVWVGVLLSVFQQLVGINVVFYYGAVLWQAAGFSESDALLINVLSGVVNVTATVIAIALIDRYGRKPLLLVGSIAMMLALGVLAFVFGRAPSGGAGNLALGPAEGVIALVAANAYVLAFGVSWGPVTWVLLGEMFNNKIRGSALSVGAAAQWIANFAVTMTFPLMLRAFGLGASYGVYAAAAAVSAVFVLRAVRETKGMTLESM
jgi:MFS family permease